MKPFVAALVLPFLIGAGGEAGAQTTSPCGDAVQVERGDNLSSIASRCAVSEAALIAANPGIQSSADLRAGMELRLTRAEGGAPDLGGRLRGLAEETGRALTGAARDLGEAVEGTLERNPELRQQLRGVGERLGLPGVAGDQPEVALSPQQGPPGATVTLSAVGLPPDTPVVVGAGPPESAWSVLDRTRTTPEGTLQVAVKLPPEAANGAAYVFVVADPDNAWQVRAPTFTVTGG